MKIHLFDIRYAVWLFCCTFLLAACSKDNGTGGRSSEKIALITPKNNAEKVSIENIDMSWQKIAGSDGGTITYDIYLDDINPPAQMVATELTDNSYTYKEKLDTHIPYYWKVVARDDTGVKGESNVEKFTTKSIADLIIGIWRSPVNESLADPIKECFKKEYIVFTKDRFGRFFYRFAGGVCEQSEISGSFEYEFISENQLRFYNHDGDEEIIDIKSISEDKMLLSMLGGVEMQLTRDQED